MYIRDPHSTGVRIFRWIVFLLAAGYFVRHVWFTADYTAPGGPFRYLTFWALTLSTVSAMAMLSISEGTNRRDWSLLVGVAAVTNALVVLLYWRLWFTDPALVNNNGPIVWYDEYYFHLLGPILQWIDALLIFGGFRRFFPGLGGVGGVTLGYIGWIELFVGPRNDFPVGSVTSGMPYPFLNSMTFDERSGFYVSAAVSVLMFLVVLWGLSWLSRKLFGIARQ